MYLHPIFIALHEWFASIIENSHRTMQIDRAIGTFDTKTTQQSMFPVVQLKYARCGDDAV
jgi:hypothetical protein